MNGLNDQRVKPLCELKHAAINIIHHTKNAGQDAFTTGISEKSHENIGDRMHMSIT